jgi:hypothetical protein
MNGFHERCYVAKICAEKLTIRVPSIEEKAMKNRSDIARPADDKHIARLSDASDGPTGNGIRLDPIVFRHLTARNYDARKRPWLHDRSRGTHCPEHSRKKASVDNTFAVIEGHPTRTCPLRPCHRALKPRLEDCMRRSSIVQMNASNLDLSRPMFRTFTGYVPCFRCSSGAKNQLGSITSPDKVLG